MNKRTILIGSALILSAGIYIGNQSARPDHYERDELAMKSKNLIRRINRKEYETCLGFFDETLQNSMADGKMQNIFEPAMEILGEFQRFRSAAVNRKDFANPQKENDSETDELIHGRESSDYINGPAVFNVLFDKNHKISGIYLE